jgi:hypothetical protein
MELILGGIALSYFIFFLSACWRLAEKAGRQGWEGIIPIYNYYTLSKVIGKRGWWMFLFFIPFVSMIAWIISSGLLAQKFGRGVGMGLGLFLLWPIFIPVLAFGDNEYIDNPPTDRFPTDHEAIESEFGDGGRFFLNEEGEMIEEIPLDEWE